MPHLCRSVAARRGGDKPQLWVGDGELKERVLPHLDFLHRPYTPTPWAVSPHLQSTATLARSLTVSANYRRQLVMTHDGGSARLCKAGPSALHTFNRLADHAKIRQLNGTPVTLLWCRHSA